MLLSEKSIDKTAHLASWKTLDGLCTAVYSSTSVQFTPAEECAKSCHDLDIDTIKQQTAQIPANVKED